MQLPFSNPIYCPTIIGRETYIDVLLTAMEQARQGIGQIVIVAGEPGIGKTRLIRETRTQASQLKLLILQGDCFEGDFNFPFAPFIDLFRRYIGSAPADEVRRQLTDPTLLKILSELNWLSAPAMLPAEPDAEKRQLFYAIWQTFVRLTHSQPLMIVIEDIHWCDETSLECLLYLMRHLTTQPILLVLSYRADEVQFALQRMLLEVDRARLATELRLKPLNVNDVDAMLRAIFNRQHGVDTEFLQALASLTEGNPFFIEEVLKSLSLSGIQLPLDLTYNPLKDLPIPRTIRDIVRRRSEQLSASAQNVLIAAAVAGRRFNFTLLQEVLQVSQSELLPVLKELISAQLVVEDSNGEFSFRHALIQQAVYSQPLNLERKAWHQKIAVCMEHYYASSLTQHWGEIAYHYYNADEWSKTFIYSQRAGEQALALYAPRSALEHITRALEAAYHLEKQIPPALYRDRAQAYQTIGEFSGAQADFESAIRIAQQNQDTQEEWQALLDLGLLWTGRDYMQTRDHYEKALALARTMQQVHLLATSLNRLGNWYMNVEQPIEALRYHQEALSAFEQASFELGVAETLMFLGFATVFVSDAVQGAAAFKRAAEIFGKYDIRLGLVYAFGGYTLTSPVHISDTLIPGPASLNEVAQRNETALRYAREMNWRAGEAFILGWLAACASTQGDYGQALTYAQAAAEICEQIGNREYACTAHAEYGYIYSELFAFDEARQHLELALTLAREINSTHFVRYVTGLLAEVYVQQGEFDLAEQAIAAALGSETAHLTPGQRRCWYARAVLAVAQGNASMALDILDSLYTAAANSASGETIPLLASVRGEALKQVGQFADAEASLRAALTTAVRQGRRGIQRQTEIRLGNLLRLQGRRAEASDAFERARLITGDLAATIGDVPLRAVFLQAFDKQVPVSRPPSDRQATKQAFGGLTAREREVAALTAKGLTNRQIAEALSISEETATVHVKHILSKLNFTSRSQIAAWAVQNNLSDVTPDTAE